jgi:hypothetical protein
MALKNSKFINPLKPIRKRLPLAYLTHKLYDYVMSKEDGSKVYKNLLEMGNGLKYDLFYGEQGIEIIDIGFFLSQIDKLENLYGGTKTDLANCLKAVWLYQEYNIDIDEVLLPSKSSASQLMKAGLSGFERQ